MSDFSKYDKLESLRFEGFELSQLIQDLESRVPAGKQQVMQKLMSQFTEINELWENYYEASSEIAESNVRREKAQLRQQMEKQKQEKASILRLRRKLRAQDKQRKSNQREYSMSLTRIQRLWDRASNGLETTVKKQRQSRREHAERHMEQIKSVEKEIKNVLNSTMPDVSTASANSSDIGDFFSDDDSPYKSDTSYNYSADEIRTAANDKSFDMPRQVSKRSPQPPSMPKRPIYQRKNISPEQMDLSDGSVDDDLFNAVIDEAIQDARRTKHAQVITEETDNSFLDDVSHNSGVMSRSKALQKLSNALQSAESSENLEGLIDAIRDKREVSAKNFNAPYLKPGSHMQIQVSSSVTPTSFDCTSPKPVYFNFNTEFNDTLKTHTLESVLTHDN